MRRSVNTPFFDQGFSMWDNLTPSGPQVAWTTGKTVLRKAILGGPAVEQHWSILSVAFQCYLRFGYDPSVTVAYYGKLGSIIAGFAMDQALSPQGGDQYLTTVTQIPFDATLVVPLWEPASDPMPPAAIAGTGGSISLPIPSQCLALSAVLSPVVPLMLDPASQPTIGIWMLPSILGNTPVGASSGGQPNGFGLDVAIASFTINYDDGL